MTERPHTILGGARAAVPLALLLALSACITSPEPGEFPEPPQPRVKVSEVVASLTASLPGADGDFVGVERKRLGAFLDVFRDGGRGPLTATVTAPDLATAERAAVALRMLAIRRGVDEDAVVVTTSTAVTAKVRPGIVLGYTDFVAVPPKCDPEVVLGSNPTAGVSPNLGCASMIGFAAMLAHPADLLQPTAEASADGASRARVVDLHRQGKATGAETTRNEDAKAAAITSMIGK